MALTRSLTDLTHRKTCQITFSFHSAGVDKKWVGGAFACVAGAYQRHGHCCSLRSLSCSRPVLHGAIVNGEETYAVADIAAGRTV